jgi:Xanthine/uracil permeases
VLVGGRVPSYLGSSFAFIAVVIAATGYGGSGANANLGVALGGIVAAGVLYAVIGAIVIGIGYGWIDRLMPPVVTGSIVAVIGLNLAPIAVKGVSGSALATWVGLATILMVGLVAVRAPGLARRLPILLGGIGGYVLYAICANGLGLGAPIDFSNVAAAAWIGFPRLTAPVWNAQAIGLIAPVAVVLVAENLGHIKAVAAMTGQNLDAYLGRAFVGDGLATIVAGAGGGTGVTTYAENIGVMAVTKVYSTLLFVVAALFAIVLGFSPKFGALIMTDSRTGAGRAVDRRLRPDHRDGRPHLGAEPRRLLARKKSHHRRRYADARRGRSRAEARRLHAGRHRHGDVWRDRAVSAVPRTTAIGVGGVIILAGRGQ